MQYRANVSSDEQGLAQPSVTVSPVAFSGANPIEKYAIGDTVGENKSHK